MYQIESNKVILYPDGSQYIGIFLILAIGDVIKGTIRHGKGIQKWKDGTVYSGDWRNDRANGKGSFTHADGGIYIGGWVDDKAEGYGLFKSADGSEYRGQWKNDYQHGFGKVNYIL